MLRIHADAVDLTSHKIDHGDPVGLLKHLYSSDWKDEGRASRPTLVARNRIAKLG
jgi:hypothetical protein